MPPAGADAATTVQFPVVTDDVDLGVIGPPPESSDPAGPSATGPSATGPAARAAAGAVPAKAARTPGDSLVRARRWTREYSGLLAAGALALGVLICSGTLISGTGLSWHNGSPAALDSPSSQAPQAPVATAGVSSTKKSATHGASPSASAAANKSPKPKHSNQTPQAATSAGNSPAGGAASSPAPKPSPTLLGPNNDSDLFAMLDTYCEARYDWRYAAKLTKPRTGTNAAVNNWECDRWGAKGTLLDVTSACRHRYGSGVTAAYLDANNAYSWRCYRP